MGKKYSSADRRRKLQKLTAEQKREEFARRYAQEKRFENERGYSGVLYTRSLQRQRKRRIQRLQRLLLYGFVALGLIVLSVILIRSIINIAKDPDGDSIPAIGDTLPINSTTEHPAYTSSQEVTPSPIPKKTTKALIALDAGHGGEDPGSSFEGVIEKDLNLAIVNRLKEALEQKGYETYLTRSDDTFVGVNKRAELVNALEDPFLFISIHQNSYDGNSTVNGTEVWCYNREGSNELAQILTDSVTAETGARNRGVYYSIDLIVTREIEIPSCIVECGYLSNPDERVKLQQGEYQQELVQGIVNGVESYYDAYYGKEPEETTSH